MQGATETARDVTMPGIEQNAAMTGNTNSTRTGIADGLVQRGLAEQSANLGRHAALAGVPERPHARATAGAEQQHDKLQARQAGRARHRRAGAGNTASNSSVANMIQQLSAAALAARVSRRPSGALDNQLKQYQSGVSAPFARSSSSWHHRRQLRSDDELVRHRHHERALRPRPQARSRLAVASSAQAPACSAAAVSTCSLRRGRHPELAEGVMTDFDPRWASSIASIESGGEQPLRHRITPTLAVAARSASIKSWKRTFPSGPKRPSGRLSPHKSS
jgi:hypothetical protein